MKVRIEPQERLDDLQIKGYKIIQEPGRFCFGMDAVLLSWFAVVKEGDTVLDMGTGTGILPILLAAKTEGRSFTGLEIQKESADMAKRSVLYNHLEERIRIVEGDIKHASTLFEKDSFSVIVTNPPYMIDRHGLKNEKEALWIARHESCCTLKDILRESSRLLKQKGRFYMVHRPFRLPEILAEMSRAGIEPKRMRLVQPGRNKEPNLVLIEGLKGGRPRMLAEPTLVVYEEDGRYTREVLEIYSKEREGE